MRRNFSDKIKLEIALRASNERGLVCCEGCGGVLKRGAWEIDHVVAEALVVDKSKPLTAKDGQLLGYCCHRGENGKTAKDMKTIAKSKRAERKHFGIGRSRNLLPGSQGTKFRKRIDGTVVLR